LNVGKVDGGDVPRYLVERTFPDGLKLAMNDEGAELCQVIILNNGEDDVTWIHSYISTDRLKAFCIYEAPSPESIRRCAKRNNLPVDRITKVYVLDPFFLR
jgi:hypothetical protein